MKRVLALLLALLMLLTACTTEEETEAVFGKPEESITDVSPTVEEKVEKPLVLAVGRDFASTHPAKITDNAGSCVVPLLYESLVSVNNYFHWINDLAQEIEQNGLTYTVTIKDAVFSDGSTVRAADVVNSMKAAMEEGSGWKNQLSMVEECVVLTATMIRITLTEPRQDFENLLTFPITKALNDGTYLGSGQYMLGEEGLVLEKNPNYAGEAVGPDNIPLKELPNTDTLTDSLKIGSISCLFDDLSSGEAMNLSERNDSVKLGNIVFMGTNGEEGLAAIPAVRRAISAAVNRQVLADRVYASKATPTTIPFHPDYYRVVSYGTKNLSYDEARKLLEDAGLVKNAAGFYGSEEQSSLRLLYNSENSYRLQMVEMIRQQLQNIGLELELVGLPYNEYMSALQEGEFDLYLGELLIDDSMDVRRLFQSGEGYGYGCSEENSVLAVYNAYQQGSASADIFLSVYQQNLPAIPLLYRQGLIVYDENVIANMESNPAEAFAAVSLGQ